MRKDINRGLTSSTTLHFGISNSYKSVSADWTRSCHPKVVDKILTETTLKLRTETGNMKDA